MPDATNTAVEADNDKVTVWQRAKLMNRYYDKIGMAATGQGKCPHFVEFRAGFGLIEEDSLTGPVLSDIPADMTDIPSEFYRGLVEVAYSAGALVCKCEIPQGAVGNPVRYNLIGIYDEDSELVAVCSTLPDWVTPTELYRAFPVITFPIEATGE